MSLPPITIPLLDPAGPIDPDNDLLLIRQGLNDRKVAAGELMSTRLGELQMLPGQLVASDVLLIGRNNGIGYDNYIMPPQYLGFLNGTVCWFWQATAPLGWSVVPNSGDRVLATVLPGGQSYQYNAVGYQGNWQQDGVGGGKPGGGLTLAQIPAHSHNYDVYKSDIDGNLSLKTASTNRSSKNTVKTADAGSGQAHNHGNIWRPLAAVGILCVKDKQVGA